MWATELQPFFMGILVSVIVGIALTLPISSAAICAALGLTGLAGGAAVAGCCAQMVGFAVLSFRENRWGGLVSQGLGTSMLQMGNIVRNPRIWIPPTLASAITGPIATCLFRLEMNGAPRSPRAWGPAAWWGPSGSTPAGWRTSPPGCGPPLGEWLAGLGPDRLRAPRGSDLAAWDSLPEGGLDQGRGLETGGLSDRAAWWKSQKPFLVEKFHKKRL